MTSPQYLHQKELNDLSPNELLNWIAKEVTRFAKRKTRAIFVNQLTWC